MTFLYHQTLDELQATGRSSYHELREQNQALKHSLESKRQQKNEARNLVRGLVPDVDGASEAIKRWMAK